MAKTFTTVKNAVFADDICLVGKYATEKRTWAQLLTLDPSYVLWCIGNFDDKFDYKFLQQVIRANMAKDAPVTLDKAKRKSKDTLYPPWEDKDTGPSELFDDFDVPF